MTATPFQIEVPDAALTDLRERLARTRWPTEIEGGGWNYGTNRAYLQELCAYWADGFDWRRQEAALNRHDHFLREVDGFRLHYIHAAGQGPDPLPLVLTHGWPSTFYELDKVIEPLADPGAHGGDPADAFDVFVPSLPGYGFSEVPTRPGYGPARIAEMWDRLFTDLGHARYGAHGGDWGATITGLIGWKFPERVVGIHRLAGGMQSRRESGNDAEALATWRRTGGGYGHIQSTRPQTLSYGLTDSPAGLAGWIIEKWHAWSDCGGDIESSFTKDELLTTVSLYWFTGTIHSSTRIYYENAQNEANRIGGRIEAPSGYAVFPGMSRTRDELAESCNVVHWSEFDRGGHFAAFEEPELVVEDIRAFFRSLR